MNLQTIRGMVEDTLIQYPDTRDDDFILVSTIYENYCGIKNAKYHAVMRNHTELKLPSAATIERMRRSVQAEYPELRAVDNIEAMRIARQEEFIEFALEG